MANSILHAALPYPVKHARFTIQLPFWDSNGDPVDPAGSDTEFSLDGAAFTDCAEEVAAISGSDGFGIITLTGAETNGSAVAIASKTTGTSSIVAKGTLASLNPRVLPIYSASTATAGSSSTITLAADAPNCNLVGCIIRTTGGTGGGGTGGANNQARVITAYDRNTKIATIEPNWETSPDGTTTYDILITEMSSGLDTTFIETNYDAYGADPGTATGVDIGELNERQALSLILGAVCGKLAGVGTTSLTFSTPAGTLRLSATVDATGRTAITLSPPA